MALSGEYLLSHRASGLTRLQLQSQVWEPHAESMFDEIGVRPRWRCADLCCGVAGIVEPLSRRVGNAGRVVGIDIDAMQVAAAREAARDLRLENVEILERDAYDTHLQRESFDLVHARFVLAPVGRDATLLREMLALTKPGGIVAIQEPDSCSWNCWPATSAWDRLKGVILEAFHRGGGDFDAGRRTFGMLQNLGLLDVQYRARIEPLPPGHPYRAVPIHFARSLRTRIVGAGLMTADELDRAIADYSRVVADPETCMTSFIVTQVWGRKSPEPS